MPIVNCKMISELWPVATSTLYRNPLVLPRQVDCSFIKSNSSLPPDHVRSTEYLILFLHGQTIRDAHVLVQVRSTACLMRTKPTVAATIQIA